jgi:hypothetical protein
MANDSWSLLPQAVIARSDQHHLQLDGGVEEWRFTIGRALQKLRRRDRRSSETLRNHRNEPRHASCSAATPMDSARSEKRAAMILVGESLPEMAVLIAVFAPLDILVQDRSLTARSVAVMLSIVVPLFALGVFLEVRQPWRD